jgi:hypothetical protein
MKKRTIAAAVAAAALVAGCSASGGGSHPHVAHPASGTDVVPSASGVPAKRTVAACAKFRSATIIMLERGPANAAALKKFGRTARRLGHQVADGQPGPDRALGTALTLVGTHALAIASGKTPGGLIAAYKVVTRDAAKVETTCPNGSQAAS